MKQGSRIGPYELLEELGRGGMATVYRAYQTSVNRYVALKIIHRNVAVDPVLAARFTKEAQLIAQLEHPHILPIYDFDGANDPPYIVMRYLPTGTLEDILTRAHLPLGDILHIFRQVGSALDYAHRQGVVHRDVKPSNIMIDGEANVFLSDFGIARLMTNIEGLTATGMTLGTPGYMAPEQGLGSNIDGRADIYALGVILFEAVTGSLPYTADTPLALMIKHLHDPIPSALDRRKDLPPQLQPIIQKVLAKRPEERYSNAAELVNDLATAIGPRISAQPLELKQVAESTILELKKSQVMSTARPDVSPSYAYQDATSTGPRPLAASGSMLTPGTQTSRPPYFLVGGAVLLVIAVLIGLLVMLGGRDDDGENNRGQVAAGSATNTVTASALPEDTATSASVSSTESPTEASERTASATERSDDSPTATSSTSGQNAVIPTIPQARVRALSVPILLGPGSAYPTLGRLTQNAVVEITEMTDDFLWVRVEYQTDSGEILSGFVPSDDVELVAGTLDGLAVASFPTLTFTPSPTDTETPLPTATSTFTDTPTATDIPTETPTATSTFTETPTNTAVPTETPTDLPPPSETPVPLPTETPVPAIGQLPYIADFQTSGALEGWAYEAEDWQIIPEGGNAALYGTSGLDKSLVILGNESPAWLDPLAGDMVIRYKFNIFSAQTGTRLIFRYSSQGYYVLEAKFGLLFLARARPGEGIDTTRERRLDGIGDISLNRWYEVTLWIVGNEFYIFLDHELMLTVNDPDSPLPSGEIRLQTHAGASSYPAGFDDILIQKPEAPSSHFDSMTSFPSDTWTQQPLNDVTLGTNFQNQFIKLENVARTEALTRPMADFLFSCTLRSVEGQFNFYLRNSAEGALLIEGRAGNISVSSVDAQGTKSETQTVENFYSRDYNTWFIELIGNRVLLYNRNGTLRVNYIYQSLPATGTVVFETFQTKDQLWIDDCLFLQTGSGG